MKVIAFLFLILILFSSCEKDDPSSPNKVTIGNITLGESITTVHVTTSQFGVETVWSAETGENDDIVLGLFCEKDFGLSAAESDIERLINKIEKSYNISFTQSNETENHTDYTAIMNETTSFVYRRYKPEYWNGIVIGIYTNNKYGSYINDRLSRIITKETTLSVNFKIGQEDKLSDGYEYFVINDFKGNAVFEKTCKPIQVMHGISVSLPIGKYIVNYNHSQYAKQIRYPGKIFAILDTLIVSKDGFKKGILNYKDAFYTIRISEYSSKYIRNISLSLDDWSFENLDWHNYAGYWAIYFNGYDPFSLNNNEEFNFIRLTYDDRSGYNSEHTIEVRDQGFGLNKNYMEFEFRDPAALIRKK